ncbi:MAG: amidohydrolase [Erysipelotrichales bacterium]|nr:amidohydrolase [Erysipelotrichales bacterium]
MNSEVILNTANSYENELIEIRRYLHTHPEVGFDLKDTKEYVKKQLIDLGYNPVECGKAGLVVTAGGKKPGKVFLIRADMDALPIKEEADVEFASTNGNMHACGHDMHTTMLLGAAKLLKEYEDEIEGTIKLMFQPAEEIFEGSKDMINDGLLENPHVDAALMIHVTSKLALPAGTILVSAPGVSAPAADYFEILVKGKGCHGSSPNSGIDPLNVAAHILISLQEIHARELSASDKAVLTIGKFIGGSVPNVIPDTVSMEGSIRTYDEDTREFLKQRIEEISKGIASAFRAEVEVKYGSGCPTLLNNKELSSEVECYVKELLGEYKAISIAKMSARDSSGGKKSSGGGAGSEDFAYISQVVPSIMLALAAGHPDKGYNYPQHHPKVKFDEEVLTSGSAVYAYTAMRWLQEHK